MLTINFLAVSFFLTVGGLALVDKAPSRVIADVDVSTLPSRQLRQQDCGGCEGAFTQCNTSNGNCEACGMVTGQPCCSDGQALGDCRCEGSSTVCGQGTPTSAPSPASSTPTRAPSSGEAPPTEACGGLCPFAFTQCNPSNGNCESCGLVPGQPCCGDGQLQEGCSCEGGIVACGGAPAPGPTPTPTPGSGPTAPSDTSAPMAAPGPTAAPSPAPGGCGPVREVSFFDPSYASSWPNDGLPECWEKRAQEEAIPPGQRQFCPLPRDEGVVCLPGNPYGSEVNRGWAMDTRAGAQNFNCFPGRHCLYACEPGYYWQYFDQNAMAGEFYAPETTTHGVLCREDGTLAVEPGKPLCKKIPEEELFVYIDNQLDELLWVCQTIYPGPEIPNIPTKVLPRQRARISIQQPDFWSGPRWSQNPGYTMPHFYVSLPGVDLQHACNWNETTQDGVSSLPWQISALRWPDAPDPLSNNGIALGTIFPNIFFAKAWENVGYNIHLKCESSSSNPNQCAGEFEVNSGNAETMVRSLSVREKPDANNNLKMLFEITAAAPGAAWKPDVHVTRPTFVDIEVCT